MQISDLTHMTLVESRFACEVPILEDGEAPKWSFKYDNWHIDPKPDVLILGSYVHPNTKNNLVGGINLHYLTPQQRDALARALPRIMQANNLYHRYHAGKRLLGDIFKNFYRTYDSKYIRGVKSDIMYPKYGFIRTASNWVKDKFKNLFKTKAQKQQAVQPKYPSDLQAMQDKLDQIVTKLQQQPQSQTPEAQTQPELQAARDEYAKLQQRQNPTNNDIDNTQNIPMNQALHDRQEIEHPEIMPTQPQIQTPSTKTPDTNQLAQQFEKDKLENQEELNDQDNLGESIIYYSPIRKSWIIEQFVVA